MSDHAVLVSAGALRLGTTLLLEEEECNHLRVRRSEDGESVALLDGAGTTGVGVLSRSGKKWQVSVGDIATTPIPPTLMLAVGAGDRDRFLLLAEKCTELGVTRLIPLVTERGVQVETRLRDAGVERARKRAREACKQSGNPWATVVDDLTRLEQLPRDVRWLLADREGVSPATVEWARPLGWLIGPEGGFSAPEIQVIQGQLVARPVRLGDHLMRFETAAIVAAARLSFG